MYANTNTNTNTHARQTPNEKKGSNDGVIVWGLGSFLFYLYWLLFYIRFKNDNVNLQMSHGPHTSSYEAKKGQKVNK